MSKYAKSLTPRPRDYDDCLEMSAMQIRLPSIEQPERELCSQDSAREGENP